MTLIFPTSNFRVVGIFHLDTIVKRIRDVSSCFIYPDVTCCYTQLNIGFLFVSPAISTVTDRFCSMLKVSDASGSSCSFDFMESLDNAPVSL